MKVLFDTNVVIDIWKKDPHYFKDSFAAYDICMLRKWETCLSVTSIPDIEYLFAARGLMSEAAAHAAIGNVLQMFSVIDAAECDCVLAHDSRALDDMEDGIIAYAALRNKVDAIVTRDKGFAHSPVPALTPAQFVKSYCPANVNYSEVEL
ncbi:MAG: PIN domain-containing protein [Coriobacteriia bacterium]|nr:PIN domain-containing protein [Coriobacteriia bacterium]